MKKQRIGMTERRLHDLVGRLSEPQNRMLVGIAALSGAVIMCLVGAGALVGWQWWQATAPERADESAEVSVPVITETSLLKIGFINDWEYGTRKRLGHKLTNQAPMELGQAVEYLNTVFRPDIVIGGGDYVESSGVKPERAKEQLALVDKIFQKLTAPRLYALGNHDMRVLTKTEVREILGIEENHAVRDIGDWRIIVLDTNFNKSDGSDRNTKAYAAGFMSESELGWLREALRTDRPVMVFSHHSPVASPNLEGIFAVNIENAPAVREVLESRGNVAAVISGHSPYGYYEERNGIHYFVVDTLVNENALGTFATVEARYARETGDADILFKRVDGGQRLFETVDWKLDGRYVEHDRLPEPIREDTLPILDDDEDSGK